VPLVPLHNTSVFFFAVSVVVVVATFLLARAHLVRVTRVLSGQTTSITKKLLRLPKTDRMSELRRLALPESIEWRIADEALQVDEAFRATVVDSVLADIALELEARASWPRTAVRIAAASGVLWMALAIALHLEGFVAIILLLIGIVSALLCLSIERRALDISTEVRRSIDALVDALDLRGPANVRAKTVATHRSERRSRRR
jgi:hypothetical protein